MKSELDNFSGSESLPPKALEKLKELIEIDKEAATSWSLAAERVQAIAAEQSNITFNIGLVRQRPGGLNKNNHEVRRLEVVLEGLESEYEAESVRADAKGYRRTRIGHVLSSVKRFLDDATDKKFAVVPDPDLKSEGLAKLRDTWAELDAERQFIMNAPKTAEEAKELALSQLAKLAEFGRPSVKNALAAPQPRLQIGLQRAPRSMFHQDNPVELPMKHDFQPAQAGLTDHQSAYALLAWVNFDQFANKICVEIDLHADPESALSENDRATRLKRVEKKMDTTMRAEAAVVWASKGSELHRPECSPDAILGVIAVDDSE